MSILIREYLDAEFSAKTIEETAAAVSGRDTEIKESAEYEGMIDENSLLVEIEGIHAYPHATRNYTRYMPKCLKESIPSWTTPYRRPMIKHHNEYDGDIIGRICAAEYKTSKTMSGTPALLFTATIPGEKDKQDIKNGNLETVSIGVIAHDVRCSVCGAQLASGGRCEHERGAVYDNRTCYWDIYGMEGKELSYVIVPSDIYAKNTGMKSPDKVMGKLRESFEEASEKMIEKHITEENIMDNPEDKETVDKELAETKASLEGLKAKVSELTEANKASVQIIGRLEEEKKKYETELSEMAEARKQLLETMEQEKLLKEGLEKALEEAKTARKESLIETMQVMRKLTGRKELAEAVARNRSEESIRDSIEDLREELKGMPEKGAVPAPNSVVSPGIVENMVSGSNKQREKRSMAKNVDLESGISKLFSGLNI